MIEELIKIVIRVFMVVVLTVAAVAFFLGRFL